jgi:hypothetical protein
MRRTGRYAAVTRDEGNAADDVLMVDQGPLGCPPHVKQRVHHSCPDLLVPQELSKVLGDLVQVHAESYCNLLGGTGPPLQHGINLFLSGTYSLRVVVLWVVRPS